jgi:hypothetical protein
MNKPLQLTIRGIDPDIKVALVKKAGQQGISLNRYLLKALRQSSGIEDSEKRYLEVKQFFSKNKLEQEDKKAFDEALSWSDQATLLKQSKER